MDAGQRFASIANEPSANVAKFDARVESAKSLSASYVHAIPSFEQTDATATVSICWKCHKCNSINIQPRVR